MKEMMITSHSHSYPVFIGENLRFQLKDLQDQSYSSVFIITDENVSRLYLNDVVNVFAKHKVHTAVIPAGEKSKSIQQFYNLHTKAINIGLDRKSLIIALGGGVVGDLAGFVAATFMRGIDYVQVPTTILAHDSSVGGKVAINHEQGKNLIGSFYSPKMVLYDVTTLQTLPLKEVRSGYAELVKEAMLADGQLLQQLLSITLTSLETKDLISYLEKGIKIKAKIVQQDEKELGTRKYLNLGHTLGHALESELGYGKITHGEAVAIGLLFALFVSEQEFSTNLNSRGLFHWLQKNEYPLQLKQVNDESIIKKMKSDKKSVNQTIQMILLKKVEEPVIVELDDFTMSSYIPLFFDQLGKWK